MRLLYISSLHGRGLEGALFTTDANVEVMAMWESGGKVQDLQVIFESQVVEVRQFQPD